MNKIKYLILFFLVLITFVFFFIYLKDSDLEELNHKNRVKVLNEFETIKKEFSDTAEFIYFTEIIKSENIVDLIASEKNPIRLKNHLYDTFEANYSYYTTLGVSDIGFYTIDGVLILNFQDINFKDSFASSIIESVINSKKEQEAYKIVSDEGYIVYSKPIFDKNLKLIAIMNIEFNLEFLLEKLEKSKEEFTFLKLFVSKFNENIFKDFISSESTLKRLETEFKKGLDSTIVINKNGVKRGVTFIKIKDLAFYKDTFYLVYYNKDELNIDKIDSFYSYFFVVFTIFFAILLFLTIYLIQIKRKNIILQSELEELSNQIDSYILKIDFDLSGKIIYVSKAFCKVTGFSKDEIIGQDINILRHTDVSENFYKDLKKEISSHKIWQGEIKNRDKFGNTYWVRITIFPRFDVKNRHIGYSSIRNDITDTKQLEKINKLLKEDLSNKLNELRLLDRDIKNDTEVSFMSRVLDSISHQWKQPISKISYEIEKTKSVENIGEESLKELRDIVQSELQTLASILNDARKIFNNSKQESTNIASVLENIETSLKLNLQKYKNCELNIESNIDGEIKIDFFEMKSILQNIILFILEQIDIYSEQSCIIKIETITNNDEITIKITENINNIEKKEFLDEILAKLDSTYIDSKLYLAKLLIEKNGAMFWCKNSLPSTTYYIKVRKTEE